MNRKAMIVPLLVLGFMAYWGFAWFCSDFSISNAPMRSVLWVDHLIGEPAFCILGIVGSIGFPVYLVVCILVLRKSRS